MRLYKKDSKNKIRVYNLNYNWFDDNTYSGYQIGTRTGLLNGKQINHTPTIITEGKAGRTIKEQVELEFKSKINRKKDKGYKTLQELNCKTEADLLTIDSIARDAKGVKKCMLVKNYEERILQKILDKEGYAYVLNKLDGVRGSLQNGNFISREGKDYNVAMTYIRERLKDLALPDLDGEIYIHGKNLEEYSGKVRKQTLEDIHKELEFHVFDVIVDLSYSKRLTLLQEITSILLEAGIKVVNAITITSTKEVELLHEKAILAGFEGIVIRDPSTLYKYGQKGNGTLKYKTFQDAEFKIVRKQVGRRGTEDMTFTCITKDGKEFDVKPKGDAISKAKLFAENNIGKMYTVKYFKFSIYGIPIQPIGLAIRDYE